MQKLRLILQIFISFFKISAFTFGGGFAMIPLLKSEVVDKHKWMKEEEMLDSFAMAQLMPGVIFINVACLIGMRTFGIIGATIATIAVLLPSVISVLILIGIIDYIDKGILDKVFKGIVCAVSGIILTVSVQLFKSHIKNTLTITVFVLALILIEFIKIKIYYILIFGMVFGIIYYYFEKRKDKINV